MVAETSVSGSVPLLTSVTDTIGRRALLEHGPYCGARTARLRTAILPMLTLVESPVAFSW